MESRCRRIGIEVLDHGYVRCVETWGEGDANLPEAGIIEAARQSTQGSFRGWEEDSKLLRHLYNNDHSTPFEFCGMVIEVQAPLFVFREWHRHRTQSYNEMSARYAPMPDVHYVPSVDRCLTKNTANRQANNVKGTDFATHGEAERFRADLETFYTESEFRYQKALQDGLPKELARLFVSVGRYSRMRASANLRNWLAFMTLRCDPNAQWEIQEYANAVATIIEANFPQTYELWRKRFEG